MRVNNFKKGLLYSHLRERGRERNIYVRKANRPPRAPSEDRAGNLGVCPTRNRTGDPSVRGQRSNQLSHASQDVGLKCWRTERYFEGQKYLGPEKYMGSQQPVKLGVLGPIQRSWVAVSADRNSYVRFKKTIPNPNKYRLKTEL